MARGQFVHLVDTRRSCHVSTPLLLVEDDPQLRRMMTTLLEDEGYPVVAVADGVDASRYVRERRPSLVVLDLNLPHLGGDEVGTRIRARYGRAVPIVLVSANEEAAGVAE